MLHMCSTLQAMQGAQQPGAHCNSEAASTAVHLTASNESRASCFLRRPPSQPGCEPQQHLKSAAMPGISRPLEQIRQGSECDAAAGQQPHLKSSMMPGISSLLNARGVG